MRARTHEELQELFASGDSEAYFSALVEDYDARRSGFGAPKPKAPPAPAPSMDDQPVTRGVVARELRNASEAMIEATSNAIAPFIARLSAVERGTAPTKALEERINSLETELAAAKADFARALDTIGTRVYTLEYKVGALGLVIARGPVSPETLTELEAVIQKVNELNDRLPLAYGGAWSQGQQSDRGLFYTCNGSIWYCRETTRDRPGSSAAFQLAVKRGRDATEATPHTTR